MSSNVEKIKERLGIVDVIGNYIKLQNAGSNFKAKCPFHNEKTPSFFVSPDRGTYYCFGCNQKGDIFTFVQEFESLDFLGALKNLAARAGVELQFENQTGRDQKSKLFELMEEAARFFESNLKENNEALDYLRARGVKKETILQWRLGFALSQWQSLIDYCRKNGYKNDELKKTGLAKDSAKKPGEIYDVFRARIMFPIFDSSGRVIAFSGRLLKPDENAPKYLNSPETELFNKSEILYGLDKAKFEIRKKNYSILVEGQMDLILSHQSGFVNTIATSGTALTAFQLGRLAKLSSRLILAYDGDSAGFRALQRGARIALSLGMNVGVAPLPKGEDPASVISKNPADWTQILKKSCHIIDFYFSKILSSNLSARQIDAEIKKKILPFIKILPSQIEQSRFIKETAEKAGLRERAVWEDLKIVQVGSEFEESEVSPIKREIIDRKTGIVRRLSGIAFWQESLAQNSAVNLDGLNRQLKEMAGDRLLDDLRKERDELIFEAENYFGGHKDLNKVVEDLLLNLAEEDLKERFSVSMSKLADLEKRGEKGNAALLLQECQEIGRQINEINSKKANRN